MVDFRKKQQFPKKEVDKFYDTGYNLICPLQTYGGIAQLARAFGSYPECHWFESSCRYQKGGNLFFRLFSISVLWPRGQVVKTRPFHGCNTSSILVGVTKNLSCISTGDFYLSPLPIVWRPEILEVTNNRQLHPNLPLWGRWHGGAVTEEER